jgi:hypothetical protein
LKKKEKRREKQNSRSQHKWKRIFFWVPAGIEEDEEEEIQRRRIDFNKLISIVTSG